MASRALLIPVALSLTIMALPSAAAGINILVEGPETGPEVEAGQTGSVTFSVQLTSTGNIVCPTDTSIPVTLAVGKADEAIGLVGAVAPGSMDFTLATGVYSDQTTAWESDSQDGTLEVSIDATKLPPGHSSHTWSVVATWDGSPPGQCQGDLGNGASASLDVNFPIKELPQEENTAVGAGTDEGGDEGATTNSEDDGGDTEESPAPGTFMIALVGLALVALRRRS